MVVANLGCSTRGKKFVDFLCFNLSVFTQKILHVNLLYFSVTLQYSVQKFGSNKLELPKFIVMLLFIACLG